MALDPKVEQLQEALADELLKAVRDGVTATDEEGNVVKLTPSPALLNVARQFVKDFPPATQPTQGAPAGVLAAHLKRLPFEGKAN